MNRKNMLSRLSITIFFIVSLFCGFIPFQLSGDTHSTSHNPNSSYILPPYIQYVVSHKIIIDDTENTWSSISWEKAVVYYPWASGQGTKDNPYKIQYALFHGDHQFGPLNIKDSDAYFVIQYCIFMNSSLNTPSNFHWNSLGLSTP